MAEHGGRLIPVGYVRRAHGIRGDVLLRPLTDNPKRFLPGSALTTDEDEPRTLVVGHSRPHNDGVIVGFDDIGDRDAALRLQGVTLLIDASQRRPLAADEFWPDDLQGLAVIDRSGAHLGRITGVVLGEAQDRLVVTTPIGREVEVPFVEPIVGEIHPSGGHIVVDPPEGLF